MFDGVLRERDLLVPPGTLPQVSLTSELAKFFTLVGQQIKVNWENFVDLSSFINQNRLPQYALSEGKQTHWRRGSTTETPEMASEAEFTIYD